jgi:hypothetical protein
MRGIALGLALVTLALPMVACGGEEPGDEAAAEVTVELSAETVGPGETLEARVRNGTSEPITYGLAYRLQREIDGEFTEVELPDRAVIQIALVANPGDIGPPVKIEVPADAEPGRWRVILADDPELSAEFGVS